MAIKTSLSSSRLTLSTPDNISLSFNGGNDRISILDSAILEPEANNFCIEFWFYLAPPTFSPYLVRKGGGGAANTSFIIVRTSTFLYRAVDDGQLVLSHSTVETNRWNHYALCRNGSTVSIFINGQRSSTNNTFFAGQTIKNVTDDLNIGSANAGPFYGYISNFRYVINDSVYNPSSTSIIVPLKSLTAISNTVLLTGQGPTIKDLSVNSFTITFNDGAGIANITPFDIPQLTERVFESGSIAFDGAGDGLTLPASSVYSFTGDFTWECWVYFNNLTGFQALFGNYTANASTDWYIDTSTTTLRVYIDGGTLRLSTTITSSIWNHIAVVRNGSTVTGYLNGVSFGTYTISATVGTASKQIFIGNQGGSAEFLNGYISNVRIVNGIALYTSNFTPSTNLTNIPNTVLLLKASSPALLLKDDSVNNFAITPNGNVAYNSLSPEITTRSLSTYFDGSGDYLTAPTNAAFNLTTGDFTIEAWVYLPSFSQTQQTLVNFTPHTTIGFSLNRTGIGDIYVYLGNGSSWLATPSINSNSAGRNLTVAAWNHVALVKNSTTVTLYVNGVNAGSSSNIPSGFTGGIYIGSYWTTVPGEYVNGYISNLRIVKGTAVYISNFTPSNVPLTAITNTVLLTCQDQTIRDASTNNFTITKNGNTTWSALTPFTNFATYKLTDSGINLNTIDEVTLNSGSLYFDGSGDYLTISTNSAFAMGTGNFTIEGWVYMTAYVTSGASLFGTANGSTTGYYVNLGSDLNTLRIVSNASGSWADTITVAAGNGVPLNTWTHIAFVRNAANITLYKNGISVAASSSAGAFNFLSPNNAGYIGYVNNGVTTQVLTGYISNLRIVKGTALYTSNFTPSASILDPITNTSLLLNCQIDNEFRDSSTNNFTLTRNGNVGFSTFSPFYQNRSGSLYFDGSGDYLTVPANSAFAPGLGDFTIECWVNLSLAGGGMILDTMVSTAAGNANRIAFGVSSSTVYLFSGGAVQLQSNIGPGLNSWSHVVLLRNSSVLRIYVNGIQTANVSNSYNFSDTNMIIGASNIVTPASFITGYISNLRFVKGTALYTDNFTPSRSALTAVSNTSLLLNTASAATDITDSSPNNFTVTRVGNTVFSNTTPVSNTAQKIYNDGTLTVREFVESNTF